MKQSNQVTFAMIQNVLPAVIGVVGVTWMLQGRLSTIEARVEPIPGLVTTVNDLRVKSAEQAQQIKSVQSDVSDLKKPLANTQANVRVILKNGAKAKKSAFSIAE